MLTAGRSRSPWAYSASIILTLCTSVLSEATAQPSATVAPTAFPTTTPATTCPAKSSWETEAALFNLPPCLETRWGPGRDLYIDEALGSTAATTDPATDPSSAANGRPGGTASATPEQSAEQDHDADSLLDGANFLSFEDWKKQNLAKVGQSAENVGGRRPVAAGKDDRRQPTGINNALDSLGDDSEIELDFGGFGAETPEASPTAWGTHIPSREAAHGDSGDGSGIIAAHAQDALRRDASRRKDAGTTCKERFNYASFDCAATVLKTNPECKGSSSVLIENKDSYMLNECRAQNKFLILELCDDILVDTVVLANYEFFSSIFHTFRVSVSDRYPAKPDQWKELGVYEARNTREVQAFAVANSLIWARYLRIEFLTHYGHEFFCPISLIRVHGTTMMEEYKHGESSDHAEIEELEASEANQLPGGVEFKLADLPIEEVVTPLEINTKADEVCPNTFSEPISPFAGLLEGERCGLDDGPPIITPSTSGTTAQAIPPSKDNSTAVIGTGPSATKTGPPIPSKVAEESRKPGDTTKGTATTPDGPIVASEPVQQNATDTVGKTTANPKEEQNNPPPESTRPTNTQPPSSNPTTQESFFKSVHKRLQMLESNSTLSLLYIEEQSRILRDAFNKVEKRQLAKTTTFLENLNVTVLSELKEFRDQYDLVWKSVALEFEHQRMQYNQEVHSLSTQLGVLADELVFQKRVTVIQSIMVLCCFAVVLFARGSGNNYMEFPGVQRMVARSYSLRSSSPIFASASPSASPGSTRPASSYRQNGGHRRNMSDSSDQDSTSPTTAYAPPTPTSSSARETEAEEPIKAEDEQQPASPESMSVPSLLIPHPRPHSTPPVMNGHPIDLDMETGIDTPVEDSPRSQDS